MCPKRPSAGWHGFDALQPGPLRDQIQNVLSTADFEVLGDMALVARSQLDETLDPWLTCTIDTSSFTHGCYNLVLEVSFSDGVYWVARIPHTPLAAAARRDAVDLLSEMATLRTIKERTSIPVPQVFVCNVSPLNDVGWPYMFMEYLPGRVLGGVIASLVPPEHLPKVAKQIADVLFQLHHLTFDRLGRLWRGEEGDSPLKVIPVDSGPGPQTSLEWFYAHRQDENKSALQDHPDDPEWKTACWVLKTALPHIIIEDRVRGPFPLCHIDLHHGNLLFDDDYNLTGVTDWAQAQTVPLERLAVSPEFITFPAGAAEVNQKIVAFRTLVREHLQRLEEAEGSTGTFSNFFGTKRAEITHRCTYSRPYRALWDGRMVAGLIYGDAVTWEQLVRVYGETEIN
jgi:aminoglycoside phosphotransferase (APT) family kinase protein